MQERSPKEQSAILIEKFLDTFLLYTITHRFMPNLNEEFFSSHQIAKNIVNEKSTRKMRDLASVYAKTLA